MAGKWQSGKLDKLIKGLKVVAQHEVAVGIVDKAYHVKSNGVATVAAIAQHLEDGPVGKKGKSWPVFRPGVKDAKYKGRMKGVIRDAMGGNAVAGLHRVGDVAANKIKTNIQGIKSPALEASTIKAKGSSNPLVDTGLTKSLVSYKIQRK